MKRLLTLGLMIAAIGTFASRAIAGDNDGQADLDKATEKKLSAISVEDLGEVIGLCESAMKKGLDASNTHFANDLYTSTLLQRATFYTQFVTEHEQRSPILAWIKVRAMALADLEKVVSKDPKVGSAHLMIAKLQQIRGGDHARALKAAEKAVELTKDDFSLQAAARVIRGNLLTDPAKQEADFDEADQADAVRSRSALEPSDFSRRPKEIRSRVGRFGFAVENRLAGQEAAGAYRSRRRVVRIETQRRCDAQLRSRHPVAARLGRSLYPAGSHSRRN